MIMDLGIKGLAQGLQSIAYKRLYLISCADEYLAVRLATHFLSSISNKKELLRFLVTEIGAEQYVKNCSNELLSSIRAHVYSITSLKNTTASLAAKLHFLKTLKKDSVCVILMDEKRLTSLDDKARGRTLDLIYHSCCSKKSSVLIMTYGQGYERVATALLSNGNNISGIASLGYRGEACFIDVMLWRDEGRFARAQDFLLLGTQGFVSQGSLIDEMQSANDAHVCYLKRGSVEVDHSLFNTLLEFDSNDEVINAAMDKATSASVILCLEYRHELEQLAASVYKLRASCGHFLHIFVVERIDGLRASSIHFLLACGVDFVFHFGVKSSYINAVLPIFLSSSYRAPQFQSFDTLCNAYRRLHTESNGFLIFDDFVSKVSSLLKTPQCSKGAGTLVALKPKPSLTLEDCLNIFNPKRGGDICTLSSGCLWIFMASCRETEVLTALQNVFTVDPLLVFGSSKLYLGAENIIKALNSNKDEASCAQENELLEKMLAQSQALSRNNVSALGISSLINNSDIKAKATSAKRLLGDE